MASEMIPDPAARSDDAGVSEAPATKRRTNPLALAWRYNPVWVVLSVAAGIVTGGVFLMMAVVMRAGGGHPAAIITCAVGSVVLLVTLPVWVIVDTWLETRHLAASPAPPEPAAE